MYKVKCWKKQHRYHNKSRPYEREKKERGSSAASNKLREALKSIRVEEKERKFVRGKFY